MSFCIMKTTRFSISLSGEEKKQVRDAFETDIRTRKKTGDLLFRNILQIADVNNEEGTWWHVSVGFYNLFAAVEALFDLCLAIRKVRPNFKFLLLGKEHEFSYETKIDFFASIYPNIEKYKDHFEKVYGIFSVPPYLYFKFRRKNTKFWTS